jgi:hypothetical protein
LSRVLAGLNHVLYTIDITPGANRLWTKNIWERERGYVPTCPGVHVHSNTWATYKIQEQNSTDITMFSPKGLQLKLPPVVYVAIDVYHMP